MRFWSGQLLHATGLAFLLALCVWATHTLGPFTGELFGVSAMIWLALAVAVPIIHQVFVWVCWRLELRSGAVSRTIGFRGYVAGFFVLFFARNVFVLAAIANRGTLGLPEPARIVLATALFVPAAYGAYSVARYFGMKRAAGADHFDERYRNMPLVTEGIFRYTSNGMYGIVFLLHWAAAIAFNSVGALVAAGFCHAYIWLHYFATEKPDMQYLYGGKNPATSS